MIFINPNTTVNQTTSKPPASTKPAGTGDWTGLGTTGTGTEFNPALGMTFGPDGSGGQVGTPAPTPEAPVPGGDLSRATGPSVPGTPAPGFTATTQVPAPVPVTASVDPTTTPGGIGLNTPGLAPPAPTAGPAPTVPGWQSTVSAPDPTAQAFNPITAQQAGDVNIPGLTASSVGNFTPGQISYQGGHQASAPGDFQRYEDAAFADAMRRLNPVWDDRDSAFKQEMANRGIAVGSDAYQRALESQNRQRDDAYTTALYDAMRYGLQAQGQAFGQSLSNAQLSQADAVNAMQAGALNNQFGLQNSQLGEQARQFDASYGLNAANSQFNQNYANAQMANAMNQFNANMGRAINNDIFSQGMAGAQFDNAIGQQNFQNMLNSAGFNRDSGQLDFQNALASSGFDRDSGQMDFANQLAAGQFGLSQQNQAFGQNLANQQLGLAANAQNWGQSMDAANLSNAMEQFAAMYGLDQARFNEGQRQFDQNYILNQMGIRTDQLGLQNQIAQAGQDNALNWANLGLNERQMMMNLMLGLGGQNLDWQRMLFG